MRELIICKSFCNFHLTFWVFWCMPLQMSLVGFLAYFPSHLFIFPGLFAFSLSALRPPPDDCTWMAPFLWYMMRSGGDVSTRMRWIYDLPFCQAFRQALRDHGKMTRTGEMLKQGFQTCSHSTCLHIPTFSMQNSQARWVILEYGTGKLLVSTLVQICGLWVASTQKSGFGRQSIKSP